MILGHKKLLPGQAGHEAGRLLLEEMLGRPLPPIGIGERGKPYFQDGSIEFSISHTKHHVFCVLSDRPVGIDAEELDRPVNPQLAKKILSAGEYRQYTRAQDQSRALLTFWVLKEAAAKASGEGLQGYPCHTDFDVADPRVREIHSCLVAVIER